MENGLNNKAQSPQKSLGTLLFGEAIVCGLVNGYIALHANALELGGKIGPGCANIRALRNPVDVLMQKEIIDFGAEYAQFGIFFGSELERRQILFLQRHKWREDVVAFGFTPFVGCTDELCILIFEQSVGPAIAGRVLVTPLIGKQALRRIKNADYHIRQFFDNNAPRALN